MTGRMWASESCEHISSCAFTPYLERVVSPCFWFCCCCLLLQNGASKQKGQVLVQEHVPKVKVRSCLPDRTAAASRMC